MNFSANCNSGSLLNSANAVDERMDRQKHSYKDNRGKTDRQNNARY